MPVATHTMRRCMWSSGSSCRQEASEAGRRLHKHSVFRIYQRGWYPSCRPHKRHGHQPAQQLQAALADPLTMAVPLGPVI